MSQGDVRIGISSTYDGKADAKAADGLKKIEEGVKKAGNAADQAAPKLKKYSNELKSVGVSADQLARSQGGGGGGGDGGSWLVGLFSRIAGRATLVVGALLGVRKVLQAVGNAPELKSFRSDLSAASTAMGSMIARSKPLQSVLIPVGQELRRFAESINPEKLQLGDFVEKLKDGTEAAEGARAAFDAMNASLEGTAEAIAKNKGGSLEEQAKRLVAGADLLESGGVNGFDAVPTEDEMGARGAKVGELLSRKAQIRNEISRAREELDLQTQLGRGKSAQGFFDLKMQGLFPELKDVEKQLRDEQRFLDPSIVDEASGRAFARSAQDRDAQLRTRASQLATPMREQARALRIQAGNEVRAANPEQYRMISGAEYQAQMAPFTAQSQAANRLRQQQVSAAGNTVIYQFNKAAAASTEQLVKLAAAMATLLQSIKNGR